jgi:S-adenosylmethionine:tRNA ribosyltransferase-isomerase
VRTADFDYDLPAELIAQAPLPRRDQSRLLVLSRETGRLEHRLFRDLGHYLRSGDLLVLNTSRVSPARLRARNARTQGTFEILLLEEVSTNNWWALMRPGRRARLGTRLEIVSPRGQSPGIEAVVVEINDEGHRRLEFNGTPNIQESAEAIGEIPLPPYITRVANSGGVDDRARYQTVYARQSGSVAAPTAGLHFTPELLQDIRSQGVDVCEVTLHVGLATFAPVKTPEVSNHPMHEEHFHVTEEAARQIGETRRRGGRIIAVGTTTVRVLEAVAARHDGRVVAGKGRTRIFIHPPYVFQVVDALITNFHLPRSTLVMLVSAFAAPGTTTGVQHVLAAYRAAIAHRYRFFSYGDAMLLR